MASKIGKAAAKRGKKSKVKKTKSRAAKKAKPARTSKKAKRKAKPRTLGQRIASGYRAVIDSMTGTEKLRKKMEQPGSDETA